jgi:hypothetical protein
MTQKESLDPMSNFMYALQSTATKRQYPRRLKLFFDFCFNNSYDLESQAIQFLKKSKDDSWAYSQIMNFIMFQKGRMNKKEIAAGTVRNYVKAIKLFCQMNDLQLNWKKISKGVPKEKQFGDDRIPRIDEIHKLLQYPDRRIRPIVCLMVSSGIRAGAWDYLKWKHIVPIERDGQIIASKIIIYSGEAEEYYGFITPEAYHELNLWMDFRTSYGEKITGESWLMRDTWQKIDNRHGNNIGMISHPKQLKSTGIKSLIDRAIRTQKLDVPLTQGANRNNRREWKALHGFRKFFNTTLANAKVHQLTKEILMGHDIGLDKNYFRPTETDLLQEYLKAINDLTINEEFRLKEEVNQLKVKQDEITIIKTKYEKEMKYVLKQMEELRKQDEKHRGLISRIYSTLPTR